LKSIKSKQVKTRVFNIEVEEDHSYVTTSFTVHNCGCGTAIAAAQNLGRQWIGIDVTHLSIALQKYRLQDMFGLTPGTDYAVIGEPTSTDGARQLAHDDRYQF